MYRIKYANRQIRDIYVCGNECSKLVARCVWNGVIRMGGMGYDLARTRFVCEEPSCSTVEVESRAQEKEVDRCSRSVEGS